MICRISYPNIDRTVATILLALLATKDFKGSLLSIDIQKLDNFVSTVHTSEFFRALSEILRKGPTCLALCLLNVSSASFFADFHDKIDLIAHKIVEFRIHPYFHFDWTHLIKFRALQSLFVDVMNGLPIHTEISKALPELPKLSKLEFEDVPSSVLTALKSLREFTFSSNRGTDNAEKNAFLRALPELQNLTKLEFEFMCVGEDPSLEFVPTFVATPFAFDQLRLLVVHSDYPIASALMPFFRSFPYAPSLRHILFYANNVLDQEDVEPGGAVTVAIHFPFLAASFPNLQSIHVSTSALQLPAAAKSCAVRIVSDLSQLPVLRRISVSDRRPREGAGPMAVEYAPEDSDDDDESSMLAGLDVSGCKLPPHLTADVRREGMHVFAVGKKGPARRRAAGCRAPLAGTVGHGSVHVGSGGDVAEDRDRAGPSKPFVPFAGASQTSRRPAI